MFGIIYNNLNSIELGLYVEKKPSIPAPAKRVETIEIEGRHGSLHLDKGYGDITITIPFGFEEKDNFARKCREITSWLRITENKNLRFTDDDEVYYKVKSISMGEFTRNMNTIGRFTCTFVVEPFAYLLEGNNVITITEENNKIYNMGTYESEPYLKIYGNGNISVIVNYESIHFNDVRDYIEIDTELMQCKKGNYNANGDMEGRFPIFALEENNIRFYKDGVTKIEIIPRWRCI